MLILIAESKTMLATEREVSAQEFAAATPCFEKTADEIMADLNRLTVGELSAMLKLSGSLAARMKKMIYEFAFKATGNSAIEAYTGVVFKSLDYPTLSPEARERCHKDVAIISSLYGWLRAQDIIKPYRLDFTSKIEGGPSSDKALNSFWRMDVTKVLVKTLQGSGTQEILNLLPADAAKCIDWKLVKRFAKVWKADFKAIADGNILKTPTAERLKALRGKLLRQILTEDINDAQALIHTASDAYVCEGTPVYPDHLQFLC